MSYSREVTLWCDSEHCERWDKFGVGSVRSAVTRAREQGWQSPSWDEHYCPACVGAEP